MRRFRASMNAGLRHQDSIQVSRSFGIAADVKSANGLKKRTSSRTSDTRSSRRKDSAWSRKPTTMCQRRSVGLYESGSRPPASVRTSNDVSIA